jgi:hypothetical protein
MQAQGYRSSWVAALAGFDLHLTKPVAPKFLHDVMSALTSEGQIEGRSQ